MNNKINFKKISFVIPCYRSENTIGMVVDEINSTMKNIPEYEFEIILVCDCSPDNVYEVVLGLAQKYSNIRGINFSKNFGQHAALMAGYHVCTGDIIVSLDDDGQTPANEVKKLLDGIAAGYDVVYARYQNKRHSGFRNFGSAVNDYMVRVMLGKPKNLYVSSYFAMRKFVLNEILKYEKSYPYLIGLILRTTKNVTNVDVIHRERKEGKSGYTFQSLLKLWLNGFTAFSVIPLRIATVSGIFFACFGFLFTIHIIINKIYNPTAPVGWSSMMAALMIIGGAIMMMLGLIGEYIGRIYIGINNSPQFVIRDTININTEDNEYEKH